MQSFFCMLETSCIRSGLSLLVAPLNCCFSYQAAHAGPGQGVGRGGGCLGHFNGGGGQDLQPKAGLTLNLFPGSSSRNVT